MSTTRSNRVLPGDRMRRMAKRKNPAAVALGRRGGLAGGAKGGHARAAALTPEQRRESARRAVLARWKRERVKTKKRTTK